MEHIFFLDPVFNHGKLYCYDNVVFILFLAILAAGILLAFAGRRRWVFSATVILSSCAGFLANWLSSLFVPAYEDVLRYLLFFTLLWSFSLFMGHLLRTLNNFMERRENLNPAAWRVMTALCGALITGFSSWFLFVSMLPAILLVLVCLIGGSMYQNYAAWHQITYDTWPELLEKCHEKK